jgi:hypothetical protein
MEMQMTQTTQKTSTPAEPKPEQRPPMVGDPPMPSLLDINEYWLGIVGGSTIERANFRFGFKY